MKKTLICIIWSLCMSYTTFAQTQTHIIPGKTIDFTGNLVFTQFVTTVENPTDTAISFTFSDYPTTDEEFITMITSSVTNPLDTPKAQLEIVTAIAQFIKSYKRYENGALIFGGQWQDSLLYHKEHSLIGRLFSTTSTQCGNNSEHGKIICLKTGYFKDSDFRHIGLENHAFTETRIGGSFAMTDYDVGTAVFMVKNPNSPNGFASYADIRNDTSLVNELYLQEGIHGAGMFSLEDLGQYKETMMSPTFNSGSMWNTSEVIDGEFILPPKSQMKFEINDFIYFIDTSDIQTNDYYQKMMYAVAVYMNSDTGCSWCIDTFNQNLKNIASLISDDSSITYNLTEDGPWKALVCFYNSSLDQGKSMDELFWYKTSADSIPHIIISSESETEVVLGEDFKMPLFVMEADSGTYVGDTIINTKTIFPLWSSGNTSNQLTAKEVNYVQSGSLSPGSHQLKLSWNQHILGGYSDWNISEGNGLVCNRTISSVSKKITNTVKVSINNRSNSPIIETKTYNLMGQEINNDFKGLRIVVSLYQDGSYSSRLIR